MEGHHVGADNWDKIWDKERAETKGFCRLSLAESLNSS